MPRRKKAASAVATGHLSLDLYHSSGIYLVHRHYEVESGVLAAVLEARLCYHAGVSFAAPF